MILHLTFLCLHVAHAREDRFLPLRLEIGLGRTLGTASGSGEAVGEKDALCIMRGERSNYSS
jgi:hypothetical protein